MSTQCKQGPLQFKKLFIDGLVKAIEINGTYPFELVVTGAISAVA